MRTALIILAIIGLSMSVLVFTEENKPKRRNSTHYPPFHRTDRLPRKNDSDIHFYRRNGTHHPHKNKTHKFKNMTKEEFVEKLNKTLNGTVHRRNWTESEFIKEKKDRWMERFFGRKNRTANKWEKRNWTIDEFIGKRKNRTHKNRTHHYKNVTKEEFIEKLNKTLNGTVQKRNWTMDKFFPRDDWMKRFGRRKNRTANKWEKRNWTEDEFFDKEKDEWMRKFIGRNRTFNKWEKRNWTIDEFFDKEKDDWMRRFIGKNETANKWEKKNWTEDDFFGKRPHSYPRNRTHVKVPKRRNHTLDKHAIIKRNWTIDEFFPIKTKIHWKGPRKNRTKQEHEKIQKFNHTYFKNHTKTNKTRKDKRRYNRTKH